MNYIKSNGTFCCVFLYCDMLRGNQHGGHENDDLQNWFDMTSDENPLFYNYFYRFSGICRFLSKILHF